MFLDNIAKSSRSSRNVLSVSLIIIATIAMYNWIVSPHSSYLFAARMYKSTVDNLVEKNKVIRRTIKTKEKRLQQLREEVKQLESVFFSAEKANEFFGDLQTIAEREGCVVNSLNLVKGKQRTGKKQPSQSKDIFVNSVALNVFGSYDSIIGLLKQIKVYPQRVWLDSIRMKLFDNDSSILGCEMMITICTVKNPLGGMSNPNLTIKRQLDSEGRKAAGND